MPVVRPLPAPPQEVIPEPQEEVVPQKVVPTPSPPFFFFITLEPGVE